MNKIVVVFAMLLVSIGIKAEEWNYVTPNWTLTDSKNSVHTTLMQSDSKDKVSFIVTKTGGFYMAILNNSKKHKSDHKIVLFANKNDDRAIVSFEKQNFKSDKGFVWYKAYVSDAVKELVESQNLNYITNIRDFFLEMFVELDYIDVYLPDTTDGDPEVRFTMWNDGNEFYYTANQMFR
jgi:uncharacterized membrane protein YciS (DUF1049 family)